jgi:DNA-binding MarR family transcriptional regulator
VAAERFSLTVEQFQVLRRIRRGFNSVSTIAEDGHTSRPSVSQAVDVLVRRGLVARQTDAVDRRHIHLSLTEEGERTLAVIYDETSLWLEAQFARLSPEEREALLTLLDLLPKAFRPG